MRVGEGYLAVSRTEDGRGRMAAVLSLVAVPTVALAAAMVMSQASRTLALPGYLAAGVSLAILIVSSSVFMGALSERVRAAATGFNELPGLSGNLAALASDGAAALAFSAVSAWPLAAAALISYLEYAESSFGPAAASAMAVSLVAAWVLCYPAAQANFITARGIGKVNPVAAASSAWRGRRQYASLVILLLAVGIAAGSAGSVLTLLAMGLRRAGELGPLAFAGMLSANAAFAVAVQFVSVVFAANWMGQFSYAAAEDESAHAIVHEDVVALDDGEAGSLKVGQVAILDGTRYAGSPVLYTPSGEYRMAALDNRSVSCGVLREMDARGLVEWSDELHRRHVLSS